MIEQELKNCKECIAYTKCPSGKRNPITRICYSDEYLQGYINGYLVAKVEKKTIYGSNIGEEMESEE